jgi:hypothetical protein
MGAALLMAAFLASSPTADAATCTIPATADQFDAFYMSGWGCGQTFINDMWSRFDFDKGDWDSGFGYEDPCNNARPLARTFNALQLLAYGLTGSPTCSTSSPNVLNWAYCWAGNQIDELDGRCGSGSATSGKRAHTQHGPIVDNYTELYWPFFYGETVVQRAGTLFHEARHASGCGHNGGTGCPRGASCDRGWSDGCEFQWSGAGANRYQVSYLSWFASTAVWTTSAVKASAVSEANSVLRRGFNTDPCFRLDSNGGPVTVC